MPTPNPLQTSFAGGIKKATRRVFLTCTILHTINVITQDHSRICRWGRRWWGGPSLLTHCFVIQVLQMLNRIHRVLENFNFLQDIRLFTSQTSNEHFHNYLNIIIVFHLFPHLFIFYFLSSHDFLWLIFIQV